MRRILTGLIAFGALASAHAQAYTAEELAQKNVEARGGAEKLHAIQSLRLSGRLRVNGGTLELKLVQTNKRPQFARSEASLQGMNFVDAYDGAEGWRIDPSQGRKDPERMSADDARLMAEDALDFDGRLIDWQEKGYALEYLGTEDVDGTQAYKLKLTRKNGDLDYVYLDPDQFLEIRDVADRVVHGVHQVTQTDYGDYEPVAGAYYPMALVSGPKGSSDTQQLQFEKAEPNVVVDEAFFRFPAPAATAK